MANNLKPCPFCNSTDIVIVRNKGYYTCRCEMCGVSTRPVDADNKDYAIEKSASLWNTRTNKAADYIQKNMIGKIVDISIDVETIKETCSRQEFEWLCKSINDNKNKLNKPE